MNDTSLRLWHPGINYPAACRTIEKVSRQRSRWLESLSLFLSSKKNIEPHGWYSVRLRVDFVGLSLRSLSTPWANDVVVGRLPHRPSFTWRNLPLSLILRPRRTSRRAYFSRTLFFSCSRVHRIPLLLRLLCSRHRPRMENRGSTNGLPWLGGLRTSMWKGEINQANRSFSPDHRAKPIEARPRFLFPIVTEPLSWPHWWIAKLQKINFLKNYIRADLQNLKFIA